MPTDTQIKIRYGLILQGVLARALTQVGVAYAETPQYEEHSETPDFLIPNVEAPEFIVEVHQTDARDHFRMKTLRSLVAVAEAKAHFGTQIVSVNVLFGDPDTEVPPANLRAMCGFFDCNVLLQRDAGDDRLVIDALEETAYGLAEDEEVTTIDAANQVVAAHPATVQRIGEIVSDAMDGAETKATLLPMWGGERERLDNLGQAPMPGVQTFYKKHMVRSLFFTDEDFAAMQHQNNPDLWPDTAKAQLVATRIGTVSEEIDGDRLIVDNEFLLFLRDADAPVLREMCNEVVNNNESVRVLFQDIRDSNRRQAMAQAFLDMLNGDWAAFSEAFEENFNTGNWAGIEHARCWFADLMPLCLNRSHNDFNRAMIAHPDYMLTLGNPFNNITIRSPRLGPIPGNLAIYRNVTLAVFNDALAARPNGTGPEIPTQELANRLLKLRLVGAMRLQKLDPLDLLVRAAALRCGCNCEQESVRSVLSDLGEEPAVGAFDFTIITHPERDLRVFVNAIAAEGNPKDKAKEWGARKLAALYRQIDGLCVPTGQVASIFVIDGVWNHGDVIRLHRSGWIHVIRMGQLEATLRDVFNLV
jgi:hypothetical protein